jgi:hypothetical protein
MYTKLITCLLSIFLLSLISTKIQAQSDNTLVINTIKQFFDGMREGDSTKVRAVMAPEARLLTVVEQKGKVMVPEVTLERFLTAIGSPQEAVWDERIGSYDVKIDDRLASVWTTYEFYLGEEFSHCGVNAFQLYKSYDGWKILEITDTRRVDNCP